MAYEIDAFNNNHCYDSNGQYHKEDGPAFITRNGHEEWYWHGKLHRENGPAYISIDGYEEWFMHGKRHREDGPAVTWKSNKFKLNEYWIEGNYYTEGEYWAKINETKKCKLFRFDKKNIKWL